MFLPGHAITLHQQLARRPLTLPEGLRVHLMSLGVNHGWASTLASVGMSSARILQQNLEVYLTFAAARFLQSRSYPHAQVL